MNSFPDPAAIIASSLGISYVAAFALLIAAFVWTTIWKGFGFWRSARNEQFWWFFFILIVNDLGILAIIYLLWFRKDKDAIVTRVVGDSSVLPEKQ